MFCAQILCNISLKYRSRQFYKMSQKHLKAFKGKWHPPFFPFVFVPFKFPPLPAKAQVNVSAKALKQLGECISSTETSFSKMKTLYLLFYCVFGAGVLGLGEWQLYSQALETFLRHVATHATLSKNSAVETFLTSTDVRKQLFFFLRSYFYDQPLWPGRGRT